MQHVAIYVIGPKMFQRTGQRLRNLHRKRGRRIIGQPTILPRLVSEFSLQKKIAASHHSRAVSGR